MSYLIEDLKEHNLSSNKKYLLDSNIWIKILAPRNNPSSNDKLYIAFVEQLLELKGKNIIVPALIVSEVMNRLLRDIHMAKFINKIGAQHPLPSDFYKNVFRPSKEYRIGYALIADDFRIYLDKMQFTNDGFGDLIKYKHVLSHLDFNLDFNDCYYYHLSKKKNFSIVTDDKDFWVKDVNVITRSQTLLDKQRDI